MNHTKSATTKQIHFQFEYQNFKYDITVPKPFFFPLAKKLYKLMVNLLFSLQLHTLE